MIGQPSAPGTDQPSLDGKSAPGAPAQESAAIDEPPIARPRPRPTTGQWLTWLLIIVAIGLAIGAIAAAASGATRGSGGVTTTSVPATGPGAGGGAGAGGGTGAGGGPGAGGGAGAGAFGGAGPGAGAGAQAAPGTGAGPGTGGGAGTGGGTGAGGARAAGRPTTGVIASIDGDTVVVTTADGPVEVTLEDGTTLLKQVPAERSDLAPGTRVLVTGERAGDGPVTASGVQILSGDAPPADRAAGTGGGTGAGRPR